MEQIYREKINELSKQKYEYQQKIDEIKKEINVLIKKIVKDCNHEWIKERESGQYGQMLEYCLKCRVDRYSSDFIH